MIYKLIKYWELSESVRNKINILSPTKARFNNDDRVNPKIQLKDTGSGFSTDTDIIIQMWKTYPHAIQKWQLFEYLFSTNETDFKEYSLTLSNKSGNEMDYDPSMIQPKIGDRIYQGDFETQITTVFTDKIELNDASNFISGPVYVLRSVCDIFFRFYNSTDSYYYNIGSGDWEVAGINDWNTSFQLSNHLDTLIPVLGKDFGIEVNLRTNDSKYTPYLSEIKMLGLFEIEFTEDMLFDTIIRTIEDSIEVTAQIGIMLNNATDNIDLFTEYKLENDGYNFTDGVSVYNLTDDPERLNNLFSSYTPGASRVGGGNEAGIVQLTGIQDVDKELEINMKYFPEISINTSLDFYEVARTPSIIFERVEKVNTRVGENTNIGREHIKDKLNLTGVKFKSPAINDLVIEYAVFTKNQVDQHRLGESLQRLFNSLNHFYSWGLDEPYPVVVRDVFRSTNEPNASNINTHTGRFDVLNVMTPIKEPKDVYLVDNLIRDITTN